jgi:protein-L-isoaspartate(D-aspartate) O-methyltransferase
MTKVKKEKIKEFYKNLDRRIFMEKQLSYADEDRPLSIGYGQTISQPSLVLEMTLLLELTSDAKVLEIGTGSGYQTAFLAEFAEIVYTIERIEALYDSCVLRFKNLDYDNIHFFHGDGSEGLNQYAPYDRIIVTAACSNKPDKLLKQLKKGGRMVAPIGSGGIQELCVFKKDDLGKITKEFVEYVQFVPLISDKN